MNWLFEPRSKEYYYDDDDETAGNEPEWDWKFILYFPIIVILLCLLSLAPYLALLIYFTHDVYSTLKKTVNTGELTYPFLVKMGAVLTVILVFLWPIQFHSRLMQPGTFLILSIGFILIFTVLPLLALCAHWLRKLIHR